MEMSEFRITGYTKKQQQIREELSTWKKTCTAIWLGAMLMAVVGKGGGVESQEGVLIAIGVAMIVAYRWREKTLYKELDVFRLALTEEDIEEVVRRSADSRDRVSG